MTVLDGRAAVQERLEAVEQERAALLAILDGYDRLAALQAPVPLPVETMAPTPLPDPPAPARHKPKRETFVCSRCPATFKRQGWRDRHEKSHPPIPTPHVSEGERIRRIPPGFRQPTPVEVPA